MSSAFKHVGRVLIHLPYARFVLNDDRTDFAFIDWGTLTTAREEERAVVGHLGWRILKGW